ncbi:hypothetical protein [Crassaminicella profunda]|uniref:hypothetical protein n=1 Tax=Crassaminicella profunda TaxID=1286698 RepID=UPI001CA67AFC|nr:hypothetical protein [Crassaminicella profunda]QZY56216.1 hypothetical protein K7H06_04305 [Crassaminicella profunda]
MRRKSNDINKKLEKAARSINASDQQLDQLSNLANKYKNKSQQDIENEMLNMINSFSKKEKRDLVKRLQMLKQMTDLLDASQTKKIDMFIRLLSK